MLGMTQNLMLWVAPEDHGGLALPGARRRLDDPGEWSHVLRLIQQSGLQHIAGGRRGGTALFLTVWQTP